ncbi:catalase-like [Pectinophora gossypiella]|uniref:catalase-like n=1 Tax=Pectinophora gossypiella TaxID=13191 RepID=UPI00214E8D59|nr:catalase-like [Pectinophora gossypiella]
MLPTETQLLEFKLEHPKPIGLLTLSSGSPVDVRDIISFNSDLLRHDFFFDSQTHTSGERVPTRVVHAKGTAYWGHFEVTHDVSKYTSADVFDGIGKKTPVLSRLSVGNPDPGSSDVARDLKGFVLKFYTDEGNLDFLCLQLPVFAFNDPIDFAHFTRAIQRNPRTNVLIPTQLWDIVSLKPKGLLTAFYLMSDYGIPNGWRYMDAFPIHAYELINKHGDRWYVRFNFRTEQGLRNLTTLEAGAIQATELDYFIRDMYNAIETKNYPSWRLEMDVLSINDVQKLDYNPFDVTSLWKEGTYKTVPIGRLTLTRNSDNQFRDQEQAAYNPANLVPGIPGPVDALFRGRRFAYRDDHNYRVGRNFDKVSVNAPKYSKSYIRDGHPPVWDNERDAPNYYPNSYNGPVPFVDDLRSRERLRVRESNAADLQMVSDFYNRLDEPAKLRLVGNVVLAMSQATEPTVSRVVKLFELIDGDLASRLIAGLVTSRNQNNG